MGETIYCGIMYFNPKKIESSFVQNIVTLLFLNYLLY